MIAHMNVYIMKLIVYLDLILFRNKSLYEITLF